MRSYEESHEKRQDKVNFLHHSISEKLSNSGYIGDLTIPSMFARHYSLGLLVVSMDAT